MSEDSEPIPSTWKQAFAWIEGEFGGRIVEAERQPRWRPAWFLELERDGARVPLYFRGDRGQSDHGVYTLEHEMRVLQVLEQRGIPVPHVYGFCPEPRGIVMERSPGRANLASAGSDAERESVLDHYMELLARVHEIDPAAFEAIGLQRPKTPREIGLCDHMRWERGYRRDKVRPEPAIEFLIGWVRRHVPEERTRVSFICCDAGQFLFENGRVTALLDLELACLGDPAADLGGMRGRDLSEPLGDLSRAFRRYADLSGQPLDRDAIDFPTVRFGLVTPRATAALVAKPPPGFDRVQYLSWYLVWTRGCLEVIADAMGLDLPAPELPSGATDDAETAMMGTSFDDYEADARARETLYRERARELAPYTEKLDLDDAATLLGRRCRNRANADASLEAWMADAGPERDAELVGFFHRRLLREEAILRPVMRELGDVRMQRIRWP